MILAALRFLQFPKKMPPSHLLRPTNLNPKTNTTGKVVKLEPGSFTFHQNGHLSLPRHHRSVNVLKSRGFSPKAESCCHQAHGHHGHPLAWTAGNVGSNIGILCLMPLDLFFCICIFEFLPKCVFRFVRASGVPASHCTHLHLTCSLGSKLKYLWFSWCESL